MADPTNPDPHSAPRRTDLDRTMVMCLPRADDPPERLALRATLKEWEARGRLGLARHHEHGVDGWAITRGDQCWVEAWSPSCIGSPSDLNHRAARLAAGENRIFWHADHERRLVVGRRALTGGSASHIDEVEGWLIQLMQEVGRAKPVLDGKELGRPAIDLERQVSALALRVRGVLHEAAGRSTDSKLSIPTLLIDRCRLAIRHALFLECTERETLLLTLNNQRLQLEEIRLLIVHLESAREIEEQLRWCGSDILRDRIEAQIERCENDVRAHNLSRRAFHRRDNQPSPGQVMDARAEFQHLVDGPEKTDVDTGRQTIKPSTVVLSASHFSSELSKIVIGQEEAVRAWSLALHLHAAKIERRGGMLMTGPSGSGKSFLGEHAAALAGVPFVHVNAAQLVPEGILGLRLGNVCLDVLDRANGNVELAERAIILFDEVDKLTSAGNANDRIGYGTTVINQLLRFIDGCDWHIDEFKTPAQRKFPNALNTKKLFIVLAGAWTSLRDMDKPTDIGFATEAPQELSETDELALKDMGLPLEMVGRISQVVQLKPHTVSTLLTILTGEQTSPLRNLRAYLAERGSRLEISPGLLRVMAEVALEQGTGARGLTVIAQSFTDGVYWCEPIERRIFRFVDDGSLQIEVIP